jgi:membrane protease subunit HflC
VPLIDNVVYVEKRILDLDSPPLEIIASDQKRLVVDAFGRYRIEDPLLFYQTVGTLPTAESRLSVVLNSAVRRVLGEVTFTQLVRDERADLMTRITDQVSRESERLGIDMVDVKIRRADLPEANSQAVYQRMQTERQREATEIRALGEQIARGIRANADRQATVIVAEANRESEQTRGAGDAERNRIFADAFGRDPEFFTFYRSMQAYGQGLDDADTQLVISPTSDFFRYFGSPAGEGGTPLFLEPAPQPLLGAELGGEAAPPSEAPEIAPAPAPVFGAAPELSPLQPEPAPADLGGAAPIPDLLGPPAPAPANVGEAGAVTPAPANPAGLAENAPAPEPIAPAPAALPGDVPVAPPPG